MSPTLQGASVNTRHTEVNNETRGNRACRTQPRLEPKLLRGSQGGFEAPGNLLKDPNRGPLKGPEG